MKKYSFRYFLFFLLFATTGHTARLPPSWLNAVVAIGHTEKTPAGPLVWVTEASGFFYGDLVKDDPDPTKRLYEVFLITNRHVIANHAQVEIRLNPKKTADQGETFPIPMFESGRPTWFTHKDDRRCWCQDQLYVPPGSRH
jgi:hypothetical protein